MQSAAKNSASYTIPLEKWSAGNQAVCTNYCLWDQSKIFLYPEWDLLVNKVYVYCV